MTVFASFSLILNPVGGIVLTATDRTATDGLCFLSNRLPATRNEQRLTTTTTLVNTDKPTGFVSQVDWAKIDYFLLLLPDCPMACTRR